MKKTHSKIILLACALAGCLTASADTDSRKAPKRVNGVWYEPQYLWAGNGYVYALPNQEGGNYTMETACIEDFELDSYHHGIRIIKEGAFYGAPNLKSVVLSQTIQTMEANAFRDTPLENVDLPDNLRYIGSECFEHCPRLKEIDLKNVAELGEWAFADCFDLRNVKMSPKIKVIDKGTFSNCTGLQTVTFGEDLEYIRQNAFGDCVSLYNVDLTKGVKGIDSYAFRNCRTLNTLLLPTDLEYIGASAFKDSRSLQYIKCFASTPPAAEEDSFDASTYETATLCVPVSSLSAYRSTLPWSKFKNIKGEGYDFEFGGIAYRINEDGKSVTVWKKSNDWADYSGIVKIPETVSTGDKEYVVTAIGEDAFALCSKLTSVNIPRNVTTIGTHAFFGCEILSYIQCLSIIPPTGCGEWTFRNTDPDLQVWVPKNYGNAYKEAECWKNLPHIKTLSYDAVQDNIYYTLDGWAIATDGENAKGDLEIPDYLEFYPDTHRRMTFDVGEIGQGAFAGCTITSLKLPETTKIIRNDAFRGCKSLKEAYLGGAQYINEYAFYFGNLEKVYLEATDVQYIAQYAFAEQPLQLVGCNSNTPDLDPDAFDEDVYENAWLEVPEEFVSHYRGHNVWKNFVHIGGPGSGDEEIEKDFNVNAPVEYFNLQGVKVSHPVNGIFIRRQGGKTTKVIM